MTDRVAAMVERVAAEVRAAAGQAAVEPVCGAVAAALEVRSGLLAEDDHRVLAPARVVRILLADTAVRSVEPLAAAAFVDSEYPGLAPSADVLFDSARTLLADVPSMRPLDDLLERLVSAGTDAAVIALAERLDQARHLHLDGIDGAGMVEEVRTIHVPAAQRLAPGLARRFARWADARERSLLMRRATT